MRRYFITVFLSFGILFSLSPFVQAAELGCCQVFQTGSGQLLELLDRTEQECRDIDLNNLGKYIRFEIKQRVSHDKKSCVNKSSNIRENTKKETDPIYFTPGVTIPGEDSDFISGKDVQIEESTATLANYIIAIFKYSTGVIGIIAAIALMVGGVVWLTAAGNHEKVSSAKTIIGSSLVGMCIAFGAFLILSLVNTNLVNFRVRPVQKLQYLSLEQVCALKTAHDGTTTAQDMGKEDCERLQTTVDPNNQQAYSKVECIKDHNAQANKCVRLYGCCEVEVVDWSLFGIVEGDQKDAYCLNRIKRQDCEEKSSSFWTSNIGPALGSQWGASVWDSILKNNVASSSFDTLNDKIKTNFHETTCQQVVECADSENGVIY